MVLPRTRVKVPSMLQMEETECGAAALGMILAYYGRYVPLEELRTACGVSRDGSKSSAMLAAARSYGLVAKGFRRPFDKLGECELPAIVFWRFSHWVVLEGFHRGQVMINDPADGRRAVALSEVEQAYSGISLQFTPGPEFEKGGARQSWVKDLRDRVLPAKWGFILAGIAGLFLVVPGILLPLFTTVFVNDVISSPSPTNLGNLLTAVAVVALLMGLLTLVQQMFLARLQTRLTVSGSFKLVDHLLHLPVQFFTQRFPGVLVGRMDQIDSITALLAGPLVTAAVSLVGLLVYTGVMLLYSPLLTAIGILAAALNIVALAYVSKRRDAANQLQLREESRLSGLGMSTVSAIESIKTTGAEDSAFERWAGFQARYLAANQDMGRLTNLLSVVPTTLSSLTTVLVLTIGGLQVMSGMLTLGILVGFQSLMASFLTPISDIVNLANQTQTAQGQLVQLNDVLSNAPDEQFAKAAPASAALGTGALAAGAAGVGANTRLAGALELRNVEFGYARTQKPVITDFSLRIAPGQRVALVGGTGSGKSTIVRLIMGLYEPWSGEVLFDGRGRHAWQRELITTSVSFVDQRIMLLRAPSPTT